tara:strand:- start:860 stop:1939 length:1080 start_codon:yes stop_codon:yes gene_type:complete
MAIRSIRDEGQMAKCIYLDDPTPSWFDMLKSNQGAWKTILKWRPDASYVNFGQYKVDDGEPYKSQITKPMGSANKIDEIPENERVYVSAHYLKRGHEHLKGKGEIYTEEDLDMFAKKILENPPASKNGWFYIKPNRREKIVFEMSRKGDTLPQQKNMPTNAKTTNPFELAVVFTTIYKSTYGNPKYKYTDDRGNFKEGDDIEEYPMWEDELAPPKNLKEVKEILDKYEVKITHLGPELAFNQLRAKLSQEARKGKIKEEEMIEILESLQAFKEGRISPEPEPEPEPEPIAPSKYKTKTPYQILREYMEGEPNFSMAFPKGHIKFQVSKKIEREKDAKPPKIGRKQAKVIKEALDKFIKG